LGTMKIAILGSSNDRCDVSVLYEIERGSSGYECYVPRDALAAWDSWINTEAPNIDDIKQYCQKIESV